MKRMASGAKGLVQRINGKVLAVMGAALCISNLAIAQSTGFNAGITQAQTEIQGTFSTVSRLMMILGAVIGVVGAIRIYIKWNNGDQDVTKAIIAWAGAALFLVLSGTVLGLIFNVA